MPIGWIGFSTATAPDIQELHDRPEDLSDYVSTVVANAGATLIGDVYFDNYNERAYVLVEGLDDWSRAKAVTRILQADEYTKLMRADLVRSAITQEQGLKPPVPPASREQEG